MRPRILPGATVTALVGATLAVAAMAPGGSGAAIRSCGAFGSQAAAQSYFVDTGGGPARRVGALDPDRDGVACEGLRGPFKGYGTIGFNKRRHFFYGLVTMPPDPVQGGYACLEGNPHYPEGPRLLTIFRVRPGPDRVVVDEVGAEAQGESGRLAWKAERGSVVRGRYYAVFAERQRLKPYGPNLCPSFSTARRLLP